VKNWAQKSEVVTVAGGYWFTEQTMQMTAVDE